MNKKPCIYCLRQVIDDEEDGYIRVIEEDESITLAYAECAELTDGIVLNELDW